LSDKIDFADRSINPIAAGVSADVSAGLVDRLFELPFSAWLPRVA